MIPGIKARLTAFSVHLSISVLIFAIFLYLVFIWWYPEPYLSADGVWDIVWLVIIVDVFIGPSLTFSVFKPGKKGLKFDLGVIASIQIAMLVYGISTIYTERPQFLVYAVDRFVLVSRDDIDQEKLAHAELREDGYKGPLAVYARLPEDPDEKQKMLKEVMDGKPDLEFRAEYYEPLKNNLVSMAYQSKDIEALQKVSTEYEHKINDFMHGKCKSANDCLYFPIIGKQKTMTLVMSRESGEVLGAIDVDPWARLGGFKEVGKKTETEKNNG